MISLLESGVAGVDSIAEVGDAVVAAAATTAVVGRVVVVVVVVYIRHMNTFNNL